MLHTIRKLLGDKSRKLIFPLVLMSLDACGSMVLYIMLYMTVRHLLNNTLSAPLIRSYTGICLVSVIARLLIYRRAYYLCFARGAEMCGDMRLDLANHYRSLGLGYFDQNSSGRLLSTLIKDLSDFEMLITHTLPSIVRTVLMAALVLIGTFFIHWEPALAECLLLLAVLLILSRSRGLVEKYGGKKRQLSAKMISIVLEYIRGMKIFKSHNMTGSRFSRMMDTLDAVRKASVKAEVKMAVPASMYSIATNFLLPIVLFIGTCLFLRGTIAPDQLAAFMLMSLALSALLISFEHSYHLLKDLNLAACNLEKACETKPLPYKEKDGKLTHFDISFENVDFSYNQKADVLHELSFHARESSVTALIGPSGSGKSTALSLIARFRDVSKGRICIGGRDIKELNPDGLLHYISEVFQENTLLSDSIYNNIRVGREDASEEEIIAAAKAAHCHEFIEKLPKAYQTRLSEGGNTLSGGEKQRIAIARAILKDAPILLLDESTASLDADNEQKIHQALDRLMEGKTVFVIAHRLQTIQNADQIILLKQGRVEEMGSHEELLEKKGHYYEMIRELEKAKKWVVKGEF
ncbi:ABC transporter, ATP-binding protein [Oribacterium sp. oral taxon 078 str. F0263]|uniref:ABC transporter ATP-binding protein n=1 Tax=Oribacterium sp. oral taxon 078 TaxID=652706 RepID=UPI0003ADD19A|nr:ABC transporter ATP-binding protein [Oribacterium sp. oral taxon 078]ERL05811.1 ABC transporter, ATP-binding protein [Oribacterium sp. oral taxon 078 str. F0263]